ncbi:hypothetical protein B0H17DRAFT_1150283 [Mycena rosella]|uniref:Uncharacterized protein n=1 Tax=Mycena rosella TaxID=1033263 RepID=A0AAD7FPA5_MYCRO|nr:hypothetical protein B0H17DRAFT_1150283 [Mycena rosella]
MQVVEEERGAPSCRDSAESWSKYIPREITEEDLEVEDSERMDKRKTQLCSEGNSRYALVQSQDSGFVVVVRRRGITLCKDRLSEMWEWNMMEGRHAAPQQRRRGCPGQVEDQSPAQSEWSSALEMAVASRLLREYTYRIR